MLLCLKLNYKKSSSMQVGPREKIRPLFLKSAMDCKGQSNVAQPMLNWWAENHWARCLSRNLPFRAKRPETPACLWSKAPWSPMLWLVLVSRKRARTFVSIRWNNWPQLFFNLNTAIANEVLQLAWCPIHCLNSFEHCHGWFEFVPERLARSSLEPPTQFSRHRGPGL